MGGLLTELSKRLAERWLAMLVLPGALLLAEVATAAELGHTHWNDLNRLRAGARHAADRIASTPTDLAISLVVLLLTAATCGLAAQAAGYLLERLWLADGWPGWPQPLRGAARLMVRRRHNRYTRLREQAGTARARAHLSDRAPEPGDDADLALRRMRRIAYETPVRPTWPGDRLHAVELRLQRDLGLRMTVIWPQLWLHAPDSTRTEITTARQALTRACTLGGWGILHLTVAALWWPGLIAPTAILFTARHRVRTATDAYATLIEAATRLHAPELARHLGVADVEPFTRQSGTALTEHLTPGP